MATRSKQPSGTTSTPRAARSSCKDLKPGDELLIQSGKGQFGSCGDEELGTLLGLITGDGHFTNRGKGEQAAVINLWGEDRSYRAKPSSSTSTR